MGREWNWRGRSPRKHGGETVNSSGCLAAVFQFFDFHSSRYAFNHHYRPSFPDDLSPSPTGVEAPRNSLDMEELPLPRISKENLQVPMGMRIKTRRSNGSNNGNLRDNLNIDSPTAKTPNLVARLMGLDLLPQPCSPSPCSHSHSATFSNRLKPQEKLHRRPRISSNSGDITTSRSLPETPRVSLARKSNVDSHSRLSLQDRQSELLSGFKRRDITMMNDENRCPNQPANQILKRVKENVSRKAGFDKTNTVKGSDSMEKLGPRRNSEEKLRSMEIKEQARKVAGRRQKPKIEDDKRVCPRRKKAQQEQPCLRSSKAAKAITARTDLPFSTAKRPEKKIPSFQESNRESQLSCSSSKTYRQKNTDENDKKHIEISFQTKASSTSNNNGRPELEYVSRIITHCSFSKDVKGHVEKPTIISGEDHGENLCYSDRKLLSDLVDELRPEILRNSETFSEQEDSEITNNIWRQIIRFPRAKCEDLDDIDRLIEGDLKKSKLERELKMAMEEGGERIVREIEKDIMEKLVLEATALSFC